MTCIQPLTWRVVILVAVLLGVLAPASLAQEQATLSDWKPLFRGVEFARGSAVAADRRPQRVTALRVDLLEPTIRFHATPENGPAPRETDGQAVSSYLRQHDLAVAVNANYFAPCCNDAPGEDKDVIGLAISEGDVVSPPVREKSGTESMLITRDNRVRFVSTRGATPLEDAWTAVSGSPALLRDGRNLHRAGEGKPEPRTAVGLDHDRRYLVLIVIDGRQPGVSEGATFHETAAWLLRLGAWDGINLDGGGSTSMAMRVGHGGALILNRPIHGGTPGRERINGNNLGVFAESLPYPCGGSDLTPCCAGDLNGDGIVDLDDVDAAMGRDPGPYMSPAWWSGVAAPRRVDDFSSDIRGRGVRRATTGALPDWDDLDVLLALFRQAS